MNGSPQILACCRVSVRETDIFRLRIQHYTPHVDSLAVVIVAEGEDRLDEVEEICRISHVHYEVLKADYFHCSAAIEALERVAKQVKADWIEHADSDEFLYEIKDIRNIIAQMEKEQADAIAWMRIDWRLAVVSDQWKD